MNNCPNCGMPGGALFSHVCLSAPHSVSFGPFDSSKPPAPLPKMKFEFPKGIRGTVTIARDEDGEYVVIVHSETMDEVHEENTRLREALKLLFLDPLASHAGRAVARNALGIPHIPFADPQTMLQAMEDEKNR